jgi:hypothetical protein
VVTSVADGRALDSSSSTEVANYSYRLDDGWGAGMSIYDSLHRTRSFIQPWLCSATLDIGNAPSGSSFTEKHVVEVDDSGRFWTNGRYGQAFVTSCELTQSASSGRVAATFQDGPSLCDDPERRTTDVRLLNMADTEVGTPQVCVAAVGSIRGRSVLSLALNRDTATNTSEAFSLYLAVCLDALPDDTFSANVTSTAIASSECIDEMASLRVGSINDQRPIPSPAVAGTWEIESASKARDGRMRGKVDMTFSNGGTERYKVIGTFDLPEVLR